jgi:hypothetical protein
VWSNLERLAEACTSWFTYDVHTGLYSWVINEAGNVVSGGSLTEADIIGPISISGSGLTNLYNAVEIEYPNTDIRDQPHYVRLELSPAARNAYEPDNTLQITSEFINNQPQAEYSAIVNLKTSRLDRTVTFVMDYTKINLRAGDIIAITSDTYAWTAKEFRIMRVREIEGDDGSLRLEFTASEYDDSIYTNDLAEFLVGAPPGIRALGSIGQPGTPTVTTTVLDSLPAQAVSSTVPAGVVDRMQFWAGNVAATGNVANTQFEMYGSLASANSDGFTSGATATFTTTALKDGVWAWKTRGVNINGVGPFSDVSGNVSFTRNQAPDVIKDTTPIVDGSGNVLGNTFDSYLGNTIASTIGNTTGNIITTANITGGNVTATSSLFGNNVSATSNISGNNVSATSNISGNNITVTTNISGSNVIASGNISAAGNVTGTFFLGDGRFLGNISTANNTTVVNIANTTVQSKLAAMAGGGSDFSGYDASTALDRSNWISNSFVLSSNVSAVAIDIRTPTLEMDYDAKDQNDTQRTFTIRAQPALDVYVLQGANISTASIITRNTVDWDSNYVKAIINLPTANTYWVAASIIPTYDLNMYWPGAARANAGGNYSTALPNEIYLENFTLTAGGDGSMDFIIQIIP